jgi:Protein kinase domain/CHAT domain
MTEVGDQIGRYEIVRLIAHGWMSDVWLARDEVLECEVALKKLGMMDEARRAQVFLQEGRTAGAGHPNILTILDRFEHAGNRYIATEYAEGGSLRGWVGRLELAQFGGVMGATLAALEWAEGRGLRHLDVKPENLLVTQGGRVKLGDFGLAALLGEVQDEGQTVGTPSYMAPELAMAQELGPATDLYAVGCVAFELLAGRPPFGADTVPTVVLLRQVNEPAPELAAVVAGTDPGLSAWVAWLLRKDPLARPASASAAWDALEDVLLRLLGPRWRRDARLTLPGAAEAPPAHAPAPSAASDTGAMAPVTSPPPDEEFRTFDWEELDAVAAPDAPEPLPAAAPDDEGYDTFGESLSPVPEVLPQGPMTPPASEPVAAPSAPPRFEPPPAPTDPVWVTLSAPRTAGRWRRALSALSLGRRPDAAARGGAEGAPARAETGTLLRRSPHIDAPSQLSPGDLFEALVFLDDAAGPRPGEESQDVLVRIPAAAQEVVLDVWLVATHHFALNDAPVKRLRLRSTVARSEPVAFKLAVQAVPAEGEEAVISATFSHNGRPSGRVTRTLAVSHRAGAAVLSVRAPVSEPAVELDAGAVAPDLTVEVASVEHDGRRFEVRVSTPLISLERSTETWWLRAESASVVEATMQRFFQPHASRAARLASLQGAGIEFYDAAPALFKEVYWRLIDSGRAPRNLYVVSDECSVPWELMVPYRRSADGRVETREPLGVELAVGRWHRQTGVSPRQRVPLRTSYVVAPRYTGTQELTSAAQEAAFVCEHFHGQRIDPASFEHVDEVLADEGADLLHFICHGEGDRGGVQVLLLENPDLLDAQQLRALPGFTHACRTHKPLVFLNACEVGRTVPGLVGAAGFARSFIDIDASGVVGTLWSVDDRTAHEVATRFYQALTDNHGTPFAEALRQIRADGFTTDGEDTFAAYCFYGDPLACLANHE